jgi:hypothetical protein
MLNFYYSTEIRPGGAAEPVVDEMGSHPQESDTGNDKMAEGVEKEENQTG